ncbi:MAG: hypothetical protein M1815_000614 [Lichina confinis]|nr:MAG: hypothetical protein M1815_000614 [Lichina confinis]
MCGIMADDDEYIPDTSSSSSDPLTSAPAVVDRSSRQPKPSSKAVSFPQVVLTSRSSSQKADSTVVAGRDGPGMPSSPRGPGGGSPWRIRVTVEAGDDSRMNAFSGLFVEGTSHSASNIQSRLEVPIVRYLENQDTSTVPLKPAHDPTQEAPKRRGRPGKSETDQLISSKTTTKNPKPRKMSTAKASASKTSKTEANVGADPPKKRRGRPRKEKPAETTVEPDADLPSITSAVADTSGPVDDNLDESSLAIANREDERNSGPTRNQTSTVNEESTGARSEGRTALARKTPTGIGLLGSGQPSSPVKEAGSSSYAADVDTTMGIRDESDLQGVGTDTVLENEGFSMVTAASLTSISGHAPTAAADGSANLDSNLTGSQLGADSSVFESNGPDSRYLAGSASKQSYHEHRDVASSTAVAVDSSLEVPPTNVRSSALANLTSSSMPPPRATTAAATRVVESSMASREAVSHMTLGDESLDDLMEGIESDRDKSTAGVDASGHHPRVIEPLGQGLLGPAKSALGTQTGGDTEAEAEKSGSGAHQAQHGHGKPGGEAKNARASRRTTHTTRPASQTITYPKLPSQRASASVDERPSSSGQRMGQRSFRPRGDIEAANPKLSTRAVEETRAEPVAAGPRANVKGQPPQKGRQSADERILTSIEADGSKVGGVDDWTIHTDRRSMPPPSSVVPPPSTVEQVTRGEASDLRTQDLEDGVSVLDTSTPCPKRSDGHARTLATALAEVARSQDASNKSSNKPSMPRKRRHSCSQADGPPKYRRLEEAGTRRPVPEGGAGQNQDGQQNAAGQSFESTRASHEHAENGFDRFAAEQAIDQFRQLSQTQPFRLRPSIPRPPLHAPTGEWSKRHSCHLWNVYRLCEESTRAPLVSISLKGPRSQPYYTKSAAEAGADTADTAPDAPANQASQADEEIGLFSSVFRQLWSLVPASVFGWRAASALTATSAPAPKKPHPAQLSPVIQTLSPPVRILYNHHVSCATVDRMLSLGEAELLTIERFMLDVRDDNRQNKLRVARLVKRAEEGNSSHARLYEQQLRRLKSAGHKEYDVFSPVYIAHHLTRAVLSHEPELRLLNRRKLEALEKEGKKLMPDDERQYYFKLV